MTDLKALIEAVNKGDITAATTETQHAVETGYNPQDILDKGLITAMDEVGENFSKGKIFIPQMLRSAKTMQECMKVLEPLFQEGSVTSKGKIIIGTVKGDLHDIGKNLVSMMMEGAGFTMFDLGVNASPERFVQKAQEIEPDIVAMSALLSTTMPSMRQTVEALKQASIRRKVKVMIGGAPVTEKYAREIEADCYAPDAGSAVIKAKEILGIA